MKIVEVGSLNMDLVVRIPRIPQPGETLLGGVFNTTPGGKGANQAVAAARLGADVTMVGCVGNDAFGTEMLTSMKAEGIDTRFIKVIPDVATGVALIQVDADAQNSIAVASGANFYLDANSVRTALDQIGKFDALLMPLETPLDTIEIAARIAKDVGALVLLNPAPAQHLNQAILQNVDFLLPNEYEVGIVAGMRLAESEEIGEAVDRLIQQGVKALIVTLGADGALYVDGASKTQTRIPSFKIRAVDTTAAGDCFVAAFAVRMGDGVPVAEAIRFANAAAGISVTREGAQISLPTRAEVEKFLSERID